MREDLLKNLGFKFIKGKVFGFQVLVFIALGLLLFFRYSELNSLQEEHLAYRNGHETINILLVRNGLNETLLALSDKSTFTNTAYLTAFWSADAPRFQKATANSKYINNNIGLKRDALKINNRLNAISALFRDADNQVVVDDTKLSENSGIISSEIEETLPALETFSANINRYRQKNEGELVERIARTKYALIAMVVSFLALMLLLMAKFYQQLTV